MKGKEENNKLETRSISLGVNKWWSCLNCCKNTAVEATIFDDEDISDGEEISEHQSVDGEIAAHSQGHFADITVKVSHCAIHWQNDTVEEVTGSQGAVLFQGKYENRNVTVKRVAKMNNQTALNEIYLLSKLENCDNVIRYLCAMEDKDYNFIITECFQRSLESFLPETSLPYKEILRQLSYGVQFLHQRNIIHLNMNPDSVRVVITNGVDQIKLTDFSRALELTTAQSCCNIGVDGFVGKEGFIAPEVKFKKKADLSVDIYSYGCLFFYVMASGETLPIFSTIADQQKYLWKPKQKLMLLEKIPSTSDCVLGVHLLKKMLKFYANARPSISEVIDHPFFWDTEKIFKMFLDVNKMFEDKTFKDDKKLVFELNQEQVIGTDWKHKLDVDVQTSVKKYDGTSLLELVRSIRNQYVHRRADNLVHILGSTDNELKDYFLGKFPNLIHHLNRAMKSLA